MTKYKKIGYICAATGGFFWSVSGVCGQFLFEHKGWCAESLVPLRLLVAGFLLTLFSAIHNSRKTFEVFKNKKSVISLLIFAIFGMAMCQYTYFKGISLSNAAIVTAIQYCSPALIIIYLFLFKRQKPVVAEIISVIVSIAGVYILSTHLSLYSIYISKSAFIYSLLSMVAVAIYTLEPTSLLSRYGTVPISGLGMLIGGIFMCIVTPPFKKIGIIDFPAICAFFAVTILGSLLSFTLFLEGTKRIGPAKANILSAIEPIGSAALCLVFMGTSFVAYDYIGILMIVSTVFILYFSDSQKK